MTTAATKRGDEMIQHPVRDGDEEERFKPQWRRRPDYDVISESQIQQLQSPNQMQMSKEEQAPLHAVNLPFAQPSGETIPYYNTQINLDSLFFNMIWDIF